MCKADLGKILERSWKDLVASQVSSGRSYDSYESKLYCFRSSLVQLLQRKFEKMSSSAENENDDSEEERKRERDGGSAFVKQLPVNKPKLNESGRRKETIEGGFFSASKDPQRTLRKWRVLA